MGRKNKYRYSLSSCVAHFNTELDVLVAISTLQTRVRRAVTFAVLTVSTSDRFLGVSDELMLRDSYCFISFFSISHLKEQKSAQKPVKEEMEEKV